MKNKVVSFTKGWEKLIHDWEFQKGILWIVDCGRVDHGSQSCDAGWRFIVTSKFGIHEYSWIVLHIFILSVHTCQTLPQTWLVASPSLNSSSKWRRPRPLSYLPSAINTILGAFVITENSRKTRKSWIFLAGRFPALMSFLHADLITIAKLWKPKRHKKCQVPSYHFAYFSW